MMAVHETVSLQNYDQFHCFLTIPFYDNENHLFYRGGFCFLLDAYPEYWVTFRGTIIDVNNRFKFLLDMMGCYAVFI